MHKEDSESTVSPFFSPQTSSFFDSGHGEDSELFESFDEEIVNRSNENDNQSSELCLEDCSQLEKNTNLLYNERESQTSDFFLDDESSDDEEREFRSSQLVKEPINVSPFFNITPREMPVSPHGVIEEQFKWNPWVMLVATIFLTKTTGKAARPWMKRFFEEFPTPYHVLDENPANLEVYFEKLGMRKRGLMIWKMSHQFVSARWRRASDLYGIGKYGEDAYRLFCLGHTDIEPTDRYLRLYLDWYSSQNDNWTLDDCQTLIEDPVHQYYSLTLR